MTLKLLSLDGYQVNLPSLEISAKKSFSGFKFLPLLTVITLLTVTLRDLAQVEAK